jgi:hypothetical protein
MRSPSCSQTISFEAGSAATSNSTANPEHPPGRTLSRKPASVPALKRNIRRMNFSAIGVKVVFVPAVSLIYTAAANRGTSGFMKHVLGIGQIATHCGSSKNPMHSVHFAGSIEKAELCSEIA